MNKTSHKLKVKSHILSLLGDELIGNDGLAVFELIKNSYDADSELVTVELNDLNMPDGNIVVSDNGVGMSKKILEDIWCVIGTDYKRGKNRTLSAKNRASLGEKGVGRLAVYKLGRKFTLVTKTQECANAHKVVIHWKKLIDSAEEVGDLRIEIEELKDGAFSQDQGTEITISELRQKNWKKKDVKDLAKKITNIKTPFRRSIESKPAKSAISKIDIFEVSLKSSGEVSRWIEEVKSIEEVLENSVYYFDFYLNSEGKLSTTYEFTPPSHFEGIGKRRNSTKDIDLLIKGTDAGNIFDKNQKILRSEDLNGIGAFCGRFYVYNLDSTVLNAFGQGQAIKSFVRENCGVRIHRDGIRVYNYGEDENDWLGMLLRRLNRMGEKFSKNTTIGAVDLDLATSHGLKEMTNREGFDQNRTYKKFLSICIEIFDHFEKEAISDRESLKAYLEGIKPVVKSGFYETLDELDEAIDKKKLAGEFSPLTKRIRADYTQMKDLMVNSGMAGLNLGIVFHELEREIQILLRSLGDRIGIDEAKKRLSEVAGMLESFSPILKQQKKSKFNVVEAINYAIEINKPRFKYHKINFESSGLQDGDFFIKGPKNLMVSAFSNIIDNSIYWLSVQREKGFSDVRLSIQIDHKTYSGPAVVISDNGDGFKMPPQHLITPFRTLKPDGMGVGLYFSNLVMEAFGGALLFPEVESGATVALVFK